MDQEKKIDYNEEPVHYCHDCLYLGNPKVVEEFGIEYCPYCGSTDFLTQAYLSGSVNLS